MTAVWLVSLAPPSTWGFLSLASVTFLQIILVNKASWVHLALSHTLLSHLTTAYRQSRSYHCPFPSPPMALFSSADLSSGPSSLFFPVLLEIPWLSTWHPRSQARILQLSLFSVSQFLLLTVFVSLDSVNFLLLIWRSLLPLSLHFPLQSSHLPSSF